jgi:hypothetical protein
MVTYSFSFGRRMLGCALVAALVLPAARAQNVLYITDGDSHSLQAIDTTNGSIVYSVNTQVNSGDVPFALSVRDSIWIISRYSAPTTANEYTLAGISTGNTVALPASLPSQFLDGATDGIHNYSLAWTGSSSVDVYSANADWSNLSVLFNTGTLSLTSDVMGITYDAASGNLWLSSMTNVYQITLAGVVVSQFALSSTERGGLAYQASTDTLWYVPNNSILPVEQYSKTGTLLQSLTVDGRSGNVWGAEFQAIPEPSTHALLALGAVLLVLGYRRRLV